MSAYPEVTTDSEHTFFDVLSLRDPTLVIGDERETTGVKHRGIQWNQGNRVKTGCNALAGVAPELDGAYCSDCGWQCRLSGAWFMDLWRARA